MNEEKNSFERHLQTGLAVVLMGFVGWVGVTVSSNAETVARLDERMKSLENSFQDMRLNIQLQMQDRYTGAQGRRLEKRVEKLENLHDKERR